jgi:hypothetical protein
MNQKPLWQRWRKLFGASGGRAAAPRWVRPQLMQLEERLAPATFTDNGTTLNLVLTKASTSVALSSAGTSYTLTLSGDNWSGTNDANVTGNGRSTLTVTAAGIAAFTDQISITDSAAGGDSVTFGTTGSTNSYANNFNINLSNAQAGSITFYGRTSFSGANALTAATTHSIGVIGNFLLSRGASLSTSSGNLTLSANQQAKPSSGNFTGITVFTASVQSGTGSVLLQGTGGSGSGAQNDGVDVELGSVTSGGGNVTVTGTAGGPASSNHNYYGVNVGFDGTVSAGGSGSVTVTGTGGSSSNAGKIGVLVDGGGGSGKAQVTSGGGNVVVSGSGVGSGCYIGVYIENGGSVSAGGSGSVTVTGTAGSSSGGKNVGVLVDGHGSTAKVTSSGGNVVVSGSGGGSGSDDFGIDIENGASVSAPGSASLSLTGTAAPNADTPAISLSGAFFGLGGGTLTSGSGNLTLTGDTIDLGAAGSVFSTANGDLVFQPLTASRPILLGGSDTSGSLVFSDTDLAALSGFSQVTIGSPTGTGAITTANNLTFTSNVTIQTPGSGSGGISLSNSLTDTGSTLTLVSGSQLSISATAAVQASNVTVQAATIGTASQPLVLAGGTLTTDSGSDNGNQFLKASAPVTLASINAGSGTIALDGGTFSVAGANVLDAAASLQVNADTFNVGTTAQTVAQATVNGGTLALGAGSVFTVTGAFTETSAGVLAIGFGGTASNPTYGSIDCSGQITLAGQLTAASLPTYLPLVGTAFQIIDNTGSLPISGSFIGLPEGKTITLTTTTGKVPIKVTYKGGSSGNSFVITSIS